MRTSLLVVGALLTACGPSLAPRLGATGDVAGEVKVLPPLTTWDGPAPLPNESTTPGVVEVTLEAKVAPIELSPGLTLDMYTYNGQVPGPLIEATVGDRVIVHFVNSLPEPTTIHWHGLRISAEMDGNPRIQSPVPSGGRFTYDFVVPDSGSFWYHPHVRSNEQVEKGLQGVFVVHPRSAAEEPHFAFDRFLVVDDLLLQGGQFAPFLASGMEGMHGRLGNTLLLNGRALPDTLRTVDVPKGRVERWRLVNTANARTMVLGMTGAKFFVIGTDGGLLKTPYGVERLELPVGQRYELEVHFDDPGEAQLVSYVMVNTSSGVKEQPYPLLSVQVGPTPDDFPLTAYSAPELAPRTPDAEATVTLDGMNDPQRGLMFTVNGQAHPTAPLFTYAKGKTVKFTIVNNLGMEHPFHLHGQFFEIPDGAHPGLKDVVLVPGGETVQIVARLDNPGEWMMHCHILEHAELGMMGELVVTP